MEQPVPAPRPLDERPVPWRAREALVVAIIALAAALIASAVAAQLASGNAYRLAATAIFEVCTAGAVVVWLRTRHGLGLEALGIRRPERADAMLGVGAGLLGIAVVYLVVQPLVMLVVREITGGEVDPPEQVELEGLDTLLLALNGVAVIVLAPIAEEMFFRGFLYPPLRRWIGAPFAAITTAAVFSGVHGILLYLPSLFVLGLILADAVERRGSVLPAIVAHAIFNAFGFAFLALAR